MGDRDSFVEKDEGEEGGGGWEWVVAVGGRTVEKGRRPRQKEEKRKVDQPSELRRLQSDSFLREDCERRRREMVETNIRW